MRILPWRYGVVHGDVEPNGVGNFVSGLRRHEPHG